MVKLESVGVDCWYKKLLLKKKRFIENLVLTGYPSISPNKKPWQQHRITKWIWDKKLLSYNMFLISPTKHWLVQLLWDFIQQSFVKASSSFFLKYVYSNIFLQQRFFTSHKTDNILDERLPARRFFKQVVYKMFTYLVISIACPCTILKENSSVHSGW